MRIATTIAGLWTVFAMTLSAQNDIAQAGYRVPEPLEIAPNQIVMITTRVIAALNPATNVVSQPEVELGGIRVSVKQADYGSVNVNLFGIRQHECPAPGRLAIHSRASRLSCHSR